MIGFSPLQGVLPLLSISLVCEAAETVEINVVLRLASD